MDCLGYSRRGSNRTDGIFTPNKELNESVVHTQNIIIEYSKHFKRGENFDLLSIFCG